MGGELQRFGFRGSELEVVVQGEKENRQVWVSVRRVCEALGILPHGQQEKLKKKEWARTQIICARDTRGENQDAFCIHLDSLPMWLSTIDENRVSPNVRPRLLEFQKECACVLRDHFLGRRDLDPLERSRREFEARVEMNWTTPKGYFSILREAGDLIMRARRNGLHLDQHTIPDISIGLTWAKYWNENELYEKYGERIDHEHYYPADWPQAVSNPQVIKVYPDAALPVFRRWVDEEYLANKLPIYLNRKVKENALRESDAEKLLQALRDNTPVKRLVRASYA